ncbi:hypothetical protein [Butyrivibrio sp.]|uniref:hypothetical protein n=1 Tax=Butyrivibrio sp. TaxID=28121 RepID=UPI0025BEE352|nr:hypothetical protein [Butyrivibrio sp.]MBQ7428395.1 recombinase family protein [Butyrivibrio sp.]MBQ9303326.1 recombinase family protein [Butyrivibrio sp.]
MIQFHETAYGKKFFDYQLPTLIKEIGRLADAVEELSKHAKYDNARKAEIRKRQAEGIERAKKAGKFQGHGAAKIDDFEDFEYYYRLLEKHDITKLEVAEKLNISRPTLDKLLKQRKVEEVIASTEKSDGRE